MVGFRPQTSLKTPKRSQHSSNSAQVAILKDTYPVPIHSLKFWPPGRDKVQTWGWELGHWDFIPALPLREPFLLHCLDFLMCWMRRWFWKTLETFTIYHDKNFMTAIQFNASSLCAVQKLKELNGGVRRENSHVQANCRQTLGRVWLNAWVSGSDRQCLACGLEPLQGSCTSRCPTSISRRLDK